ncbi:uncharacterized protein LOC134465047 [Engraulis encrasicolus]|uniref:uncharacterized protein LOC134465047 n=1 Tax=Engraulis encrasicolus TaxID=184585 RepID=UPI002FD4A45F
MMRAGKKMTNPLSLCLLMAISVSATVQGIFYPFGSAVGDTFNSREDDSSSPNITLAASFPFFGRTYQQIHVNHNGHLTFNQPDTTFSPPEFPSTSKDIIAVFWTDIDNRERGNISYQQYTTGDVLHTATRDINSYFPHLTFTASWVFVATWDRVAYFSRTQTEATFQVVLISDSSLSFVLMNYGDIASPPSTIDHPQIGYDTIASTHYGSLRSCYVNGTIDSVNLNSSSNVGVAGRWAFVTSLQSTVFSYHVVGMHLTVSSAERLNETAVEERILKPLRDLLRERGVDVSGIRLRSLAGVSATAQGIFYPFGSAVGDTFNTREDDSSSPGITLASSFPFFGRTYQQIYVNHNGHLTFNQSDSTFVPPEFPLNSTKDIIAVFWTDIDNRERGNISYQQYTTGDVLHTATRDINSYFPHLTFTASWVFVATWDRVAYFSRTQTEATFQVVLISDSSLSFVLMNYGDIASPKRHPQIGYDTIASTHYGSLRSCYVNGTIDSVSLNSSSNVGVEGRWAFVTSLQSTVFSCPAEPTEPDHVVGMRLTVSSAERLNETAVEERILKPLRDLLRERGVDVSGIRLRSLYQTEP